MEWQDGDIPRKLYAVPNKQTKPLCSSLPPKFLFKLFVVNLKANHPALKYIDPLLKPGSFMISFIMDPGSNHSD